MSKLKTLLIAMAVCIVHTTALQAQQRVAFPQDFTPALDGREVIISGPMYVTGNYHYSTYNPVVTMAPEVLFTGTDVVLPGNDYDRQRLWNNENKLTVNNFRVSDVTVRVGSWVDELRGVVSVDEDGRYSIRLKDKAVLHGNERPAAPKVSDDCSNLRIVGANLEFFLASPSCWGSGYGADNESAFFRQRTKIVAALAEMEADIYALCEVEEGDYTLQRLADWLNDALGTRVYACVDGGDTYISTYTKNAFIYRSDRIKPVGAFTYTDNDYLPLRHVAQCFRLTDNGEQLIVAMNHFKSKSGNGRGADADRGDGQSAYNLTRTEEAEAVLAACRRMAANAGESDVLILGDLNAYSYEDPVRTFTDAGYVNELKKHSPTRWSYCYSNEVGNLDQALATPTLDAQIVSATPWDINASEPTSFEYGSTTFFQPEHYTARYSDHNPIIVSLDLGHATGIQAPVTDSHTTRVYTMQGVLVYETEAGVPGTAALHDVLQSTLAPGTYILQQPGAKSIKFQISPNGGN